MCYWVLKSTWMNGFNWSLVKLLNKDDVKYVLTVFLISRILFYFISWIIPFLIDPGSFAPEFKLNETIFDYWIFWDGYWFRDIAMHGYWYNEIDKSPIVFFPLYPLLTSILAHIFSYSFSQLLLSNLCFIVASIIFYRLLIHQGNTEAVVKNAILFLCLSYGTAWFASGYSESLFLLLVIGQFYFSQKQQKIPAVIFGYLSGLTRATALYSIPALIFLEFYQKKITSIKDLLSRLLLVFSPLLGLLSYFAFLSYTFGKYEYYFLAQKQGWSNEYSFSLNTVLQKIPFTGYELLGEHLDRNLITTTWFLSTLLLIFSILALLNYKKSYWMIIYTASFALFFGFTVQHNFLMHSIFRYSITLFPMYYAMGLVSAKQELVKTTIVIILVALCMMVNFLIFSGRWLN